MTVNQDKLVGSEGDMKVQFMPCIVGYVVPNGSSHNLNGEDTDEQARVYDSQSTEK